MNDEIIKTFRIKLLQIFRLKQTRDFLESKKKTLSLQNNDRRSSLLITYSSVDLTHSILLSRFFDSDTKSFSLMGIVKRLGFEKQINLDSYFEENRDAIKTLIIWRGNVFAHDNFDVTMSSYVGIVDEVFSVHFLDFYFKDLVDILINVYLDCVCLNDGTKIRNQVAIELSTEIDQRRTEYEKSLENNFI